MAHKYLNSEKQSGFTIVELLIVIVVIGILAAITIVSYSGITARANATKAQTNGANSQKVAEAYNADNNIYPATAALLNAGSTSVKMPSGVTAVPDTGSATTPWASSWVGSGAAGTSTDGLTRVSYACLTTCTNSTGGRISYWDFVGSAVKYIYVGAASVAGPFVYPLT
jgi:prepilin-type N-terminal cleavage/methylation domain-containing protein